MKANGIYDAKQIITKEFGYAPDFKILKIEAPDGESLEYIHPSNDPDQHIWSMDDNFTS